MQLRGSLLAMQAVMMFSACHGLRFHRCTYRFLSNHCRVVRSCVPSNLHSILSSPKTCIRSTSTDSAGTSLSSFEPHSDDLLRLELPSNEDSPELLKIRHTSAHVMAMAVQRLFPRAKVTIGPWIDNGFYYDFHVPEEPISVDDLKRVKKEMDKIIKNNYPIHREELSRDEARKRIEELNEPYKLEILDSIQSEPITLYSIGDEWWDLCAGPHLDSTGQLTARAIELQSVAGAYWRGDEKNAMLQRIYGTAWQTAQQLKAYKAKLQEAKLRDHRVLGRRLDLFSVQEEAGGGLVFWHPKGAVVRSLIESYWKDEHVKSGYELLYTPHIANLDLWQTSGHADFYKDDMFQPMQVEGQTQQLQIRPMNCPFHCLLFKDKPRSYRELPVRWAELGTVYRYERSGTLHGLFRVRGFTQDDAHIFCLPAQLEDEIVGVLQLAQRVLGSFGFGQFDVMLSTRPEQSVGSTEIWEKATTALVGALNRMGWEYRLDEGGGAFYGPKIDIKIRDAIGRKWQCSTIQCDFNLPERFGLEYTAADQSKQRPIMLHRAIFGSLERFMGVLVESSAGDLPLWLAPVQLRLLPVVDSEETMAYCREVQSLGRRLGLRVEVDCSGHRLAKQIRTAEQERVPLAAVVGEQEVRSRSLAVRARRRGDLGSGGAEQVLDGILKAAHVRAEFSLTQTD